jgi:DNA-binding FrmR family transcriptional regulator
MKYGYYESKPELAKRLNRVEGQIRGIARMVEDDKYCIDILTQVSAAQAALDKISLSLLKDHARHCMMESDEVKKSEKADELIAAISRML